MLRQSDEMSQIGKGQSLPPWLWVWFILYIFNLPSQIELFKEDLSSSLFSTDPTYANLTLVNRFEIVNADYWIPSILLFLGVMSVFFPRFRKYYVERKYNLNEDYQPIPAVKEIEEFLGLHAPDLRIKANFLNPREMVFIYPVGYRKRCIAIFGRLIKSWRSDREATQAILFHEIGHCRNGDALILGAGSLFELGSRSIILFLLLKALLFFIDLTKSTPHNIFVVFILSFLNLLPDSLAAFLKSLAFFVLPIAGIWCAELNADRFMVTSKISSLDNSLKVIGRLKNNKSFILRHFYQISHPPNSLRRWMALHSNEEKSVLFYIFFFPLANLFQLLTLVIYAFTMYIIIFLLGASTMQEFSELLLKNVTTYINMRSLRWLLFSILIILWPFLEVYWVKLFIGTHERYNRENCKTYFLSALVLLFIFVLTYSI